MEVVVATEAPARVQGKDTLGVRPGKAERQYLVRENAADGLGFDFYRSTYPPGDGAFQTPRHHHGFQQLQWVESGWTNYGPDQFFYENDIGYFPKGAYYGPQLKDTGVLWRVQFGFDVEWPQGKEWMGHRPKAMAQLREQGRFEGGFYFDTDPDSGEERVRDAAEAIADVEWFMATGQKYSIATEGYESPIVMHPHAFEYFEDSPGVEVKHLGRFYDHPGPNGDLNVAMVRLSNGGIHTLGPDRAQLAWSRAAGLHVGGTTYPALTALYSPRDEKVEIGGDGIELHVLELPRLD